ncbi:MULTISPECIES: glycosyltransferase family 4 protein [Actinomycetospora]|jgi:UDP-GlcNAc:undecaprenyl-phosphate/decaprenyl-phosphate GlcNAc-1-phosphate transferase|uniref:Glycosyltransferase family 4 protein n=1 Tax=Actinomycetospora chibensis TaxID=663606 RepID=A0ABV9RKM8_9PSEU|nr:MULTISPECIES: MraY family glycosyltransferase [Actinomycetospora]MDD7916693.1 MraY family glycosyltransferase [Actinomycetospora callitridis]MDD7924650.1 MraY family glycosyltransferase [Actinomycetospora chibensis]
MGLPIREYLLVGLCAAVVTYLLTGLVRRLAIRAGAIAVPRGRDVHTVPIPRLGGIAIYLGVVAGVFVASQLPVLRRAFDYSNETVAVLVAGGLIVTVGALDDRYGLDALTKLAGQATAAGVLVLMGVQWTAVYLPWGGTGGSTGSVLLLGQDQGVLITVFLCVLLVNAMNFVDGLDGLAAGIGTIAATATCAFALGLLGQQNGDVNAYPPALIAAVLAGACAGFLPHNFQPARLFMGDSGSMFIGLTLAAATTTASGRTNYSTTGATGALALVTPLIVVAAVVFVPLLDLLMAVVRRTRAGTSPFAPDKMHLHHRLLEIGHSQRRAVLLIYLWAGVLAFGAVALALIDNAFVVVWIVTVGVLVAVLASAVPRLRPRA